MVMCGVQHRIKIALLQFLKRYGPNQAQAREGPCILGGTGMQGVDFALP